MAPRFREMIDTLEEAQRAVHEEWDQLVEAGSWDSAASVDSYGAEAASPQWCQGDVS